MNKPTLLIDGDILAFKASAAAEKAIQWSENFWTLHADLRDAQKFFYEQVASIDDAIDSGRKIFALSPKFNFRYRIWPQYKANRKDKRRPMCLQALKEWMASEYEVYQRPDIEADDVLGILGTSPYIVEGRKIIVSIDKDFKGVPCRLFNLNTGELTDITESEANRWHMTQTLMGDSCDGYGGCPKCGQVSAQKILGDTTTYDEM